MSAKGFDGFTNLTTFGIKSTGKIKFKPNQYWYHDSSME